jgi:hypothetical protein
MASVAGQDRTAVFRRLARHRAQLLGPTLDHAYPVDHHPCFDVALEAIDEAERKVWGYCDPAAEALD